jgi:hypothetical protein
MRLKQRMDDEIAVRDQEIRELKQELAEITRVSGKMYVRARVRMTDMGACAGTPTLRTSSRRSLGCRRAWRHTMQPSPRRPKSCGASSPRRRKRQPAATAESRLWNDRTDSSGRGRQQRSVQQMRGRGKAHKLPPLLCAPRPTGLLSGHQFRHPRRPRHQRSADGHPIFTTNSNAWRRRAFPRTGKSGNVHWCLPRLQRVG